MIKRMMAWLWEWLGAMPSTNARIFATICVFVLTAMRYLSSGAYIEISGARVGVTAFEPNWDWLGFLLLMAGIDAAQYFGKRTTHKEPPQKSDVEDQPTSEVSTQ